MEPEGIETPPPGKSSEKPWSKHREPEIRNVEVRRSSSTFLNQSLPEQNGLSELRVHGLKSRFGRRYDTWVY